MEREILFRGKRMDNGEWVYGYLVFSETDNSAVICTMDAGAIDVDPDTVGQYTCLTINGKQVFEGDIISIRYEDEIEYYRVVVKFGECGGVKNTDVPVGYQGFFFEEITNGPSLIRKDPLYFLNSFFCKIIGNIYDNSELLEVQR